MPENLVTIREVSFLKGMNDNLAPEHVPAGFLIDALNCFVRTDEIVKRKGYTVIGSDVGSSACQGLRGVRFANGTKELLGVFGGTIYKWTGSGSWSSLGGTLNSSGYVDIVVANNNVYFFDGTNTVPKYDGSSVSTVAGIPVGSFAKWFHNILCVGGISATPSSIRLSDLGDPEAFSSGIATTIAVNPNDGDYLTGFGELKDELLAFKSKRIWSLTGWGTASLTVANLNDRVSTVGTIAPRSIISTGNDVLYMSFQGDIPHVRSVQRTRFGTLVDGGVVSQAIETSLNQMNKTSINMVAAIFDGRNAWFAVPHSSSTTNDRVYMYDTFTEGWVRHTGIRASCWETFAIANTVQIYFGESGADGKAYVMDTATSDNGTAINFSVTSRRYGKGVPEAKKKFKYFYLTAKESGDYDLTVEYSKDGFTFESLGTMNLSGSGAVFDDIILDTSRLGSTDIKRKRFNLPKDIAYYNQFQISDTSATSSVTLRDWEVMVFPRGIREV